MDRVWNFPQDEMLLAITMKVFLLPRVTGSNNILNIVGQEKNILICAYVLYVDRYTWLKHIQN